MPSPRPNRFSSTSTANDANENNLLSSSSQPSSSDNSKPGLFERLKWQSSSKRKNDPTSNSETHGSDYHSPFNLAQRLRALLDSHPVNSPAPRFQPLPTPDESPTLSPVLPLSPVISGSPLPIPDYDPLPLSPALCTPQSPYQSPSLSQTSSPTMYFSPQPSANAELVALLSSPEFMNGSLPLPILGTRSVSDPLQTPATSSPVPVLPGTQGARGSENNPHIVRSPGRRQSVFSILDRIGSPKSRARKLARQTGEVPLASHSASPRGRPMSPAMSSISSVLASGYAQATYGSDGMNTEDESIEDDTSIMLYSPLMPTAASLVSLADSEMVSVVDVHEEENEEGREERTVDTAPPAAETQGPEQPENKGGWSWSNVFSVSSWWSSSTQASSSSAKNSLQPTSTSQTHPRATALPQPAQPHARRRRVWVPSRTQLSLETTWWGYRIYIPPPVLETLDTTSIETNRRAAVLTAALTWFFTHFPVHVLPLTVRPVIVILQGLVPYLGYLGGLLSWSWGTIKSYDEGYGIILTATWLLPIALIPSTWVPPEWPVPPSAATTITPLSPDSQSTPVPPFQSSLATSPPPAQPHQFSPPQESWQIEYYNQQPFPVYSPYSHTSVLSPLPQHFGSLAVPAPSISPYFYPNEHPAAVSPVMARSMMTPPTMHTSMMAPILTPSPSSPDSYVSAMTSPSTSPAMYTAPTPSSPIPLSSSSSRSTTTRKRRSKNGESQRRARGSLNAPRMATVPLPEDGR